MRAWASMGLTILAALAFAAGGLMTLWALLLTAAMIGQEATFHNGALGYVIGPLILALAGIGAITVAVGCLRLAIRVRIPQDLRTKD